MSPADDADPALTLLEDIHGDAASRREHAVQRAVQDLERTGRPARTALDRLRSGRRAPPVGVGPDDAIPVGSAELMDTEGTLVTEGVEVAGPAAVDARGSGSQLGGAGAEPPEISENRPKMKSQDRSTIAVVTGRGRDVVLPPPQAANIDRSAKDR